MTRFNGKVKKTKQQKADAALAALAERYGFQFFVNGAPVSTAARKATASRKEKKR